MGPQGLNCLSLFTIVETEQPHCLPLLSGAVLRQPLSSLIHSLEAEATLGKFVFYNHI